MLPPHRSVAPSVVVPAARVPLALVVDGAAADRELHCLLLRQAGVRTVAAVDGIEALVCARTLLPDLVVADVRTRELDGWGLLARLRAAPSTAHIPVLLVTGEMAPARQVWMARGSGATAILGKPLDLGAFRQVTGALLAPAAPR